MNARRIVTAAAIASLLPHIFCCVLPTISSIAGMGTALGLSFMNSLHMEWIHEYEIELLYFSGFMIALAGAAQLYARKMDCHHTGCCHEPCAPRKNKARIAFYVACGLFAVNLAVHFFGHHH